MPGCETTTVLAMPDVAAALAPLTVGLGVDFGCEVDPHPCARVLVDGQHIVHDEYRETHEVHVRDINAGFADWLEDPGRRFDFVWSSHLLEHVLDPHRFLREAFALLRDGGHLILVLPDQDFYWPRRHPHANPDHQWWDLSPEKVLRWAHAASGGRLAPVFRKDATACEGGQWGFVLAWRKEADVDIVIQETDE